jgi:hypothetical protein
MAAPRTTTVIFDHEFNPNYDIVWSFQFLLSGNQNSSGAFTTFLTDTTSLTTPGTGIDVGYSGEIGLSGAKICVGFDTTGLFASSFIYPDSSTRDGIALSSIQPDMLVIRGGFPDFSLIYSTPLSALSDSFELLRSTENYQIMRVRLGDIGRKIYIDWRPTNSSAYINLTSVNTNLSVNDSTEYYIGYSFTTPVSTTSGWEESVLYIKQPVYEGKNTAPTYTTNTFEPIELDLCDNCLIPTQYYTVSADIPPRPIYSPIRTYVVYTDCSQETTRLLYSDNDTTLEAGPLYIEPALVLTFTGNFVNNNNLYDVVDGEVTFSTVCGLPTPTPEATPSPSLTQTPPPTFTLTPTPEPTESLTPTPTPQPTFTPTPTLTQTPQPTPSPELTATPTPALTPTPTPTP